MVHSVNDHLKQTKVGNAVDGRNPANHLGCIKPCNGTIYLSTGARFLNHHGQPRQSIQESEDISHKILGCPWKLVTSYSGL